MIKLRDEKVHLFGGDTIVPAGEIEDRCCILEPGADYRRRTMAYSILQAHNESKDEGHLSIKFDALASHDITYVGIVQTARASGMTEFPIPYALTNCHNSLCAVGGTINEDDHSFGLSAARKYGGIYVPAHLAVIHQYMREMMAGCGKMILGSDSHTRYGALGTMAMGEGGPELVKQLLNKTYETKYPEVCLVYLKGQPPAGVGPHDVALDLIGKVFRQGFVKNMVLEFAGPGVNGLSMDFRNGIDVMTTETACLSSIWTTDEKTREYFRIHGREDAYNEMKPLNGALYDKLIEVDLSETKSMIALPFHPSNTYTIREFMDNAKDILREIEKEADGMSNGPGFRLTEKAKGREVMVDQGIIAGCAGGTYENILATASVLKGKSTGSGDFSLSVYPQSQPVYYALNNTEAINTLMNAGAIIKTAFCGPCFGAGDVPANNGLSIRHTTRNFQSREGSKPDDGQMAGVALMDARSIAVTAARGGILTPADETDYKEPKADYTFNGDIYENRVYKGFGRKDDSVELKYGPNIKDWPEFDELKENMLLLVASVIDDRVTTTDELIPSGETSSYRSNPVKLAEFTLSRKDPEYVGRAKEALALDEKRRSGELLDLQGISLLKTKIGSLVYANRPGDGSAREQAASCQKVLGGQANIAIDYATKRYRSNLVNWGMLPFTVSEKPDLETGDYLYIENIRGAIEEGRNSIMARNVTKNRDIELYLPGMTEDEREIILDGCLINNYRKKR